MEPLQPFIHSQITRAVGAADRSWAVNIIGYSSMLNIRKHTQEVSISLAWVLHLPILGILFPSFLHSPPLHLHLGTLSIL